MRFKPEEICFQNHSMSLIALFILTEYLESMETVLFLYWRVLRELAPSKEL